MVIYFLNDAFYLLIVLLHIAFKNAAENETMLDLNLDQARIKIQLLMLKADVLRNQ